MIILGISALYHDAAACLVVDGEIIAAAQQGGYYYIRRSGWDTTTIGVGKDNSLTIKEKIKFPHSLGLLYSAFTYFMALK